MASLSRNLTPFVVLKHHVVFLLMATVEAKCLLANVKKRRSVAHASLTKLGNLIKDLEGKDAEPKTLELAQRMSQKLSALDSEFRTHQVHVCVILEVPSLKEGELGKNCDVCTILYSSICVP